MAERTGVIFISGGQAEEYDSIPHSQNFPVDGICFSAAPTDGAMVLKVFVDDFGAIDPDHYANPIYPILREVYSLDQDGIPVDAVTVVKIPFGQLDEGAKRNAAKEIWEAANKIMSEMADRNTQLQLAPAVFWDSEEKKYVRI